MPLSKKTVLITGATGFVGKNLIPVLEQMGFNVICAVSKAVDWLNSKQVIVGRIEAVTDWSCYLGSVDVIIHLAAKVHVVESKVSLEEFCTVNSIATRRLAEQAAAHGVKRFIFLSSIKVNGEFTMRGKPFTEEYAHELDTPYALSKMYAEQSLLNLSKNTNMDVVILRPSLIFGPGVKANFLKMIKLVDKGLPLPFAGIHNKRNFVFIENLVSSIVAVINEPRAANQVYLVADNEAWSLSELLVRLGCELDKKARLFKIPGLVKMFSLLGLTGLSTRLFASLEVSNEKIKRQLDWNPPYTSAEGLAKTIRWYQEEVVD